MTFSVKPIDPKLFAEIYTPMVAKELDQFIYASKNWATDLQGKRWALDEGKRACLLRTPMMDRMDSHMSYSFVWEGQTVLIRQIDFCQYKIVHASPMPSTKMDEIKRMMREALLIGGELLKGIADENNSFAVPAAEFFE